FRWSRSMLMNLLCGYGEKPWKAVVSSVAIVIGFFIFYLFKEYIKANPPEALRWWDYLYFSIVTFTTLGYGDIRPLAAPGARMVASGEAFIGAFMIALFVWTLARRYVAR
ncbi:MAG: potassium channel family protein, partial [Candidatus Aminicenantes bacterium]|nr:potassium channel family protein [Candidatus Aminicenantes bacterium]